MTKDEVIDIISDSGYCLFATVEGDQPRVRPLAPYLTDSGQLLVSLVPGSRTAEQIKINPQVELCFVDRKMCFCRVSGKASLSEDQEKKETIWNNVPNLRQYFSGPDDPNLTLMEVEIGRVEAMNPSQEKPEEVAF